MDTAKVLKNIEFWRERNNLPSEINEDIIAFIGPTKAGKSTLINCLMGTSLLLEMDANEDICLVKAIEHNDGPKIGGDMESQTLVPERSGELPGTSLVMYDFPGFGDNKGTKQEIANAIAIKAILCQQTSVRFVLVVPFDTIKNDDPSDFFELLTSLLAISPDIANHLCLVASQMNKGNLELCLKDLTISNVNNEKAKEMIDIIIQNNAFISFKRPKLIDDQNIYTFPCKAEVNECLEKLKGINISKHSLVISSKAKVKLEELYTSVYNGLNLEIQSFEMELKEWTTSLINNIKQEGNMKRNICVLKAVIKELKENCLIKDLIGIIKTFEIFEKSHDVIKIATNFEFLEELRNNSAKPVRGTDEFYLRVICAIECSIKLLDDVIKEIDRKESCISVEEEASHKKNKSHLGWIIMDNLLSLGLASLPLLTIPLRAIFPAINIPFAALSLGIPNVAYSFFKKIQGK